MKNYYHFTDIFGLKNILSSGFIKPNQTHHSYDVSYISFSRDGLMVERMKDDAKYSSYYVRLEVCEDIAHLSSNGFVDIEYNINFFRANEELSAYVFTDLGDNMEYLYDDNYLDSINREITRLNNENESVFDNYINLSDIKEILILDNCINYTDLKELEELLINKNINYRVIYDW